MNETKLQLYQLMIIGLSNTSCPLRQHKMQCLSHFLVLFSLLVVDLSERLSRAIDTCITQRREEAIFIILLICEESASDHSSERG